MPIEIIIAMLIFVFSLWLIIKDFDAALTLLLILSVLLHKEFFSIYHWDLLPVRIFMLAFAGSVALGFAIRLRRGLTLKEILKYLSDPFILLLFLLWLVSGISIIFSKNLQASLLYFGFFTTVSLLGLVLYLRLKNDPQKVFALIKTYFYVILGLSIFGFVQLVVYLKTGFIFGALWNVPGHIPRIGATFWDVNHFGALLAGLLPVLGVSVLTSEKWKGRLFYLTVFAPSVVMLLLTNSRSAWIIASTAFLVFITLLLIRRWGQKGLFITAAGLLLLLTPLVIKYQDKDSLFRAEVKQYFHYRIDSFDTHFMLLRGAVQIFAKYPFFGGGLGGFSEQFSQTKAAPEFFARDPVALQAGYRTHGHSIWGELIAETGIAGTTVYVLLMSLIIFTLFYASRKSEAKKQYLILSAMAASLIGWLAAGIFYTYKAEFFWLIFFLYFIYGRGTLKENFRLDELISKVFKNDKAPYVGIGILALILIFFALGKNHFIPWDEAIYAKVAKNMVESGRYLVQEWIPGKIWYEKPPLYMWLAAFFMKIFGVGELAARLPSAVFGFLTVLLVYKFSRELFNRTAAYVSALALLTTVHFLYYSRTAMLDMATTFFITFSLYSYWRGTEQREKTLLWILSGAGVGLGAMTKNVVGFLPLLVIGFYEIYLLFSKKISFSKDLVRNYLLLLFSALSIYLPWHLYMYLHFGQDFVQNYYLYHVFSRATLEIEDKGRPFFWYLTVMKVSMRIWFAALLGALPLNIFLIFFRKSKSHLFLLLWALSFFLFFSISKSKLVWYIIPIYPVLSIMIGCFTERALALLMHFFRPLRNIVFKGLAIFLLTTGALFYLFLVREMAYPSDLTGSQARLLQEKDKQFCIERVVFVNKIDLPLSLFYTDGPYRELEFAQLEKKIEEPLYDEEIIFVTKESRLRALKELEPNVVLVKQDGDYALGRLESPYGRDKEEMGRVQNQLSSLRGAVLKTPSKATPEVLEQISALEQQEYFLKEKIKNSLEDLRLQKEIPN